MTLKEFKDHILEFSSDTVFQYGISDPFSWRGAYSEVAFAIHTDPTPRDEILEKIEKAYTELFIGYKGGEYGYGDNTEVHFESDTGSWTDGEYVANWIAEVEGKAPYYDQEERLVKLAFTNF